MRTLLFAGIIAVFGLAATSGPAAAQGTIPPAPYPVPGVDNFVNLYDAETARLTAELVARMRDAIARCDRPAWERAFQDLRNLAGTVSFQVALVRRSIFGAPAGSVELLFMLLFDETALGLLLKSVTLPEEPDSYSLRYPDPCERRVGLGEPPVGQTDRVAFTWSGQYVGVNAGYAWGTGTIEAATVGYAAATSGSVAFPGFAMTAEYRLGVGFLGRNRVFAEYSYAAGTATRSGEATIGVDGVTNVGLTYLYPTPSTGVGTGAPGDMIEATVNASISRDRFVFGYGETLRPYGSDRMFNFTVAAFAETVTQRYQGTADIIRGVVTLADQQTDALVEDRYAGLQFGAAVTLPVLENARLMLGGYLAPALHRGWGEINQSTTFGGTVTQQLTYAESGLVIGGGVSVQLSLPVNDCLTVSLGAGASWLPAVTQALVPAGPPDQPGGFARNTAAVGWLSAGARFRF